MPDTFDTDADLIGAVGPGATAYFQGWTPEQVTALVTQVITALRATDPNAITRDADGAARVGDTVVSPAQQEVLAQSVTALPADAPAETRRRLAVSARMVSDDLVPPADFAARAREYAERQRARGGPLDRSQAEEPVYVPLQLRFSRATRPAQDALFERDRTFDDIQTAVDAPDPQSGQRRPFPAMVLLGEPGSGKSTSLRHLALRLLQTVLSDPSASLPLFVNLGDHATGSPADFLADQWTQWYGADDLPAVLKAGRLWLLADGLNEMPAADERDYEARVKAWRLFLRDSRRFPPGNRALVACRTADYGTGLDLPRLSVEPMDDERIADFIAARFRDAPDRGDHLLAALRDDRRKYGAEHGLYGLARNPFWLVMLTEVYRQLDHLPPNRAALIQAFVDHWLAYEADRLPGRVLTQEERAALQLALDTLAFAALDRGQNTPQPQTWVLNQLPEQVDVSGQVVTMPPETTLKLAESACLVECRGRPEARTVRFYHQLLLEHFAGRELLRRFNLQSSTLSPRSRWSIPWAEKWQFVESAWDPLPPPPTTGWEEATVLAAARAALPGLGAGEDDDWPRLALAVLPHNPPLAARCLLEAGVSPLPPAAEKAKAAITDHLLTVINDPTATADLDPRQRLSLRIACGRALGHLDDPRILAGERRTPDGVRFILPQWSRVIPAGPFLMGSRRDDPHAYDDEYSPATGFRPHPVEIPYDYVVGRYPVTNAEYACFVQDGGYQKEKYWRTENARAWLRGELDLAEPWVKWWRRLAAQVRDGRLDPDEWLAQRRISPDEAQWWKWAAQAGDRELEAAVRQAYGATGERATQPRFWDDLRYNNPSQPVVGVCWFEAMAYCAWLTERVGESAGQAGVDSLIRRFADSPIRLPGEAEWAKAARWDGRRARRYPWEDDWDESQANTLEGRVLATTPVGVYPEGAAPCGALDMAGNVWEWTRSRWGPEVDSPAFGYPYDSDDGREEEESSDLRVVRGGSWDYEARAARAAHRDGDDPGDGSDVLGFRLALRLS